MTTEGTVRFTGVIRINGINPYVTVSARRAGKLRPQWRKPMPVLVRINGHPKRAPWKINMMPMGNGDFYLYLHGSVRRASGTAVGDRVQVVLAFDTGYRNGPMQPIPAWFRKPLHASPRALAQWKLLTPSRQKEIVRYLGALKSPEAQQRNLVRAMSALERKPGRFMGRSWGPE